jgi:feruloyl esterase
MIHRMLNVRGVVTVALALAGAAVLLAHAAAVQDPCSALASASLADTTIKSATSKPATTTPAVPAFCEVQGTITPVEGSRIGVVFRLPADWNGKVLGIGGGGAAGNVSLGAAAEGLSRGYAVIQNDLGHSSASPIDWSFAVHGPGRPNTEGIIDFGHRATHVATVVGKQVVEKFYGRAAQRAYFQGCSTGGRQGLAEVQRYPDDYDGVISGAPVFSPVVFSTAVLRAQLLRAKPENELRPDQVQLIRKAAIAACDAKDGVADNILIDPRACTWDPGELACTDSSQRECLTPAQVDTVRRLYAGDRTNDGTYVSSPLMRGSEADWPSTVIGTPEMPLGMLAMIAVPFVANVVKHDPSFDFMTFDRDRDIPLLRSGLVAEHVHQQNAEISAFLGKGGKLLLWHGYNDTGPSALSTIDYYEAVRSKAKGAVDGVRLFLLPGVGHCRGGEGPDRFDALSAIDAWVQKGVAPASIVATKANNSMSRPLCPYPQSPSYPQSGDTNAASSFTCSQQPPPR